MEIKQAAFKWSSVCCLRVCEMEIVENKICASTMDNGGGSDKVGLNMVSYRCSCWKHYG